MGNLTYLSGVYSLLDANSITDRLMQGVEQAIGASIAIRAAVLKRYPFNCRLGRMGKSLISGEDSEPFLRLIKDGYRGAWVPGAKARHVIEKIKMLYM
ncbi:MAG: hypothetical protein IRY99_19690 [Isosphaeraceae bacterium]|nr:hypothetical protein [Isosphaeraceae bacterium]